MVPTSNPEEVPLDAVFRKSRPLIRQLEALEHEFARGNYERAIEEGNRLKGKLQKMRKGGLEKGRVFQRKLSLQGTSTRGIYEAPVRYDTRCL